MTHSFFLPFFFKKKNTMWLNKMHHSAIQGGPGATHLWPLTYMFWRVLRIPEGLEGHQAVSTTRFLQSSRFSPKPLPQQSRKNQGAAESWKTPFLIFLLLPGLWSPGTVHKEKAEAERGWGRTPHMPERGQGVAKEVSFSSVYFKRTKN